MEKFIEFDLYEENVYIQNMLIHGRYLYAVISIGETEYINVIRIDLENEDAAVLYSDEKNREKAAGISLINENFIISAAAGYIYKSDLDMQTFETLTAADNIRQLDIYDGYVYYCDTINKILYRHNIKSGETEMLLDGVTEFCIDGDFMYYILFDKNNIIYKANLKSEYIDFYNKVEIYKPEQNHYLGEWSIKNEYLYTTLYYGGVKNLVRIKLNSGSAYYLF